MKTFQTARRMLGTRLGVATIALAFSAAPIAQPLSSMLDAQDRAVEPRTSVPQLEPRDSLRADFTTESGSAQDLVIAQRVQAALGGDPELKAATLRTRAENGQVTITGSVEIASQRDRAIQIASAVPGVVGVQDGMTLRQPSQA